MIKTLLITTLEKLGYPVYLQNSMDEDEEYPASFITFMTVDSYDAASFDNSAVAWGWQFQVIFYSSDPNLVMSEPAKIAAALKAAGFIPRGRGMDIPSDVDTHTGWEMEFYYLEV